jgi:mannose-6-phosphate isomerase-like protein (cupin superfamily)
MLITPRVALPFIVGPAGGSHAPLGNLGTVHKVPGFVTEGRVAIVEHTLAPRTLAAPLHRHSREDELSFVLYGTLGAKLGDEVVVAGAGSYVLKPRGQWHTFWNAGATALHFVELLIPGGLEGYFERLSPLLARHDPPDTAVIRSLATEYGLELDLGSVAGLCQRFGLET